LNSINQMMNGQMNLFGDFTIENKVEKKKRTEIFTATVTAIHWLCRQ
jgi:hypothetical protein